MNWMFVGEMAIRRVLSFGWLGLALLVNLSLAAPAHDLAASAGAHPLGGAALSGYHNPFRPPLSSGIMLKLSWSNA